MIPPTPNELIALGIGLPLLLGVAGMTLASSKPVRIASAILFGFAWATIFVLGMLQIAHVLPTKILCVGVSRIAWPKGFVYRSGHGKEVI